MWGDRASPKNKGGVHVEKKPTVGVRGQLCREDISSADETVRKRVLLWR